MKKVLSGHECFPWLTRMIVKNLPLWVNDIEQIKRWELSIQAKHCIRFGSNYILLSWNDQVVTLKWDIIVG